MSDKNNKKNKRLQLQAEIRKIELNAVKEKEIIQLKLLK